MTNGRRSKLKTQLFIFLVLFISAEIVLRACGSKPGTWFSDLKIQDHPEYEPRLTSDEQGINHILRISNLLMPGAVINRQGFRDTMDYTPATVEALKKNTGKEVVMFIGDSYVEGCCPENMSKAFPDIVNRTKKYAVLNFGIAGTDPLQYEMVAKKYVPLLKPDRVLVVVYLGNDLKTGSRQPTPGVPILFPFKNNKWIYQVAPDDVAKKTGYSFKSADEAYRFYIDNYTLKGSNRNVPEKALGYSVILSKLYLGIEHAVRSAKWNNAHLTNARMQDTLVTNAHLANIARFCAALKTPCTFVAIPEPKEAADAEALTPRYGSFFKNIPWAVPYDLTLADYDGKEMYNHFNNSGSKKYAGFLEKVLDAEQAKK